VRCSNPAGACRKKPLNGKCNSTGEQRDRRPPGAVAGEGPMRGLHTARRDLTAHATPARLPATISRTTSASASGRRNRQDYLAWPARSMRGALRGAGIVLTAAVERASAGFLRALAQKVDRTCGPLRRAVRSAGSIDERCWRGRRSRSPLVHAGALEPVVVILTSQNTTRKDEDVPDAIGLVPRRS